jgi:hypothetical protein
MQLATAWALIATGTGLLKSNMMLNLSASMEVVAWAYDTVL